MKACRSSVATASCRSIPSRSPIEMGLYPTVESHVKSGQAPDFAGEAVPAELREAVNAGERAKEATIYMAMKIALKYMQALEQEEEFIEYLANLLIDLYATDS